MLKKKLIVFFSFFIILGVVWGTIDYKRIENFKEPIFMVKVTSGKATTWHYLGLGYRIKREINESLTEPYYLDNEVRFGLWFYTWKLDFSNAIKYVSNIEVEISNSCDRKLYYLDEERSIYLYCLNSIKFNNGTINLELKDYLAKENKSIDDFIKMFSLSTTYKDGGSKLYKDLINNDDINGFDKEELAILECNTLEGNRDVYLGPFNMEYQENFCKFIDNTREYKNFIRTYEVDSIHLDSKDENFIFLTLSQFQGENKIEVRVLKFLTNEVKMGYTYEFTFQYEDDSFEDKIESIFQNATLIEIKETDKVGLSQIQEQFKVEDKEIE